MAFIDWRDELCTKVVKFNEEHKVLIKLINEMHDAMMAGKGKDVLSRILLNLVTYTQTHFKNEEEFMAKNNYAGLAAHKKEHEDFVAKVTEFKKDFESGKIAVSISVFNFLNTWLVNHIQKVDVKYGELVN